MLPTVPLAQVIKFLFCRVALICLEFVIVPGFPPFISHQLFLHLRAVMMFNI